MKRLVIQAALVCALLALPVRGQGLFGPIVDVPAHVMAAGAGCDASGNCSADFGYAEKISGATYSYTSAELIPNFVALPSGKSSINVKTVTTTGVEQIVYQQGRLSVLIGAAGGTALPTANAPSFNFTTAEHATIGWRLNKVLNTMPGTSNNHLAVTPYFTQIAGVPNGNTIAVRLHFIHAVN